MNKKHSISSLINMLYILYVMYFINTMSIAKDMAIFSEQNQLTKLIPTIIVEQQCPYLDCDDKDFNSCHLFAEENGEVVVYLRILEKGVSYEEISIGMVAVKQSYCKKNDVKSH